MGVLSSRPRCGTVSAKECVVERAVRSSSLSQISRYSGGGDDFEHSRWNTGFLDARVIQALLSPTVAHVSPFHALSFFGTVLVHCRSFKQRGARLTTIFQCFKLHCVAGPAVSL